MADSATVVIREAAAADLPALSAFMRGQQQERGDVAYLRHWYFDNPVRGGTVMVGERGEAGGPMVAMATMNAHRFERQGESALVPMPQKVLTDESLRGQGIFGRLYRATEARCRELGGDFFVTVTNAASTPIFLGKFGYLRLPSPTLAVLAPLPGPVEAHEIGGASATRPSPSLPSPLSADASWRMAKDADHYRWRFLEHPVPEYLMFRCVVDGAPAGELFLKRVRKRGVPVMLLLDLVPVSVDAVPALLRCARRLALGHRTVALLCLDERRFAGAIDGSVLKVRRSSGFNLLVKGRDDAHTRSLARERFDLALGDLDFF